MNWKCFLGFHDWEQYTVLYPYETPYKKRSIRYVVTEKYCLRCRTRKIIEVDFDTKDLNIWRSFKEKK